MAAAERVESISPRYSRPSLTLYERGEQAVSEEVLVPEIFLLPIEQYQGPELRLRGLQELREVQREVANTLPIQTPPQLAVTSPELFNIYQQ